jgi:hypothetical protein
LAFKTMMILSLGSMLHSLITSTTNKNHNKNHVRTTWYISSAFYFTANERMPLKCFTPHLLGSVAFFFFFF